MLETNQQQQRPATRSPAGTFLNPWPDSALPGFRAALRMLGSRVGKKRAPTPPRGALPAAVPAVSYPRAGDDVLAATWIGHSTVLLQIGGLNVLTDPMFGDRASPFPFAGPRRVMAPAVAMANVPPLDVVLLSHNHYDHLDAGSVRELGAAHPAAVWVVPLRLGATVRRWGVRTVVELDWWQQTEVNGLTVAATPARHFSGRGLRRNRTLWCGFALEAKGRRIYFAGDTAYHPEFGEIGARYGPFELVMIPIGAYDPRWFMHVVHADPEEAVQIYRDLVAPHARAALPTMLAIHWGTCRLTDEPMDEPPRRALARWHAMALEADRLWVARFGETRSVDRR